MLLIDEQDQFKNIDRINVNGPCVVILEDDYIEFQGYLQYCEIVSDGELNARFSSNELSVEDSNDVVEEVQRISPRSIIEQKIDFRTFDTYIDTHPVDLLLEVVESSSNCCNIKPSISNKFRLPYNGKIKNIMISDHVTLVYKLESKSDHEMYIYILHYSELILSSTYIVFNKLSLVVSDNSHMTCNTYVHKYINILKRMYICVTNNSCLDLLLNAENSVVELLSNHSSVIDIKFIQTTGSNIFKYYFRFDDIVFITDPQTNTRKLLDHSQWNEIFI